MLKIESHEHEGKQVLEISSDCSKQEGSPSDANKINLSSKPEFTSPTVQATVGSPLQKVGSYITYSQNPVKFAIRMWAYNGYLIIKTDENSFAIFNAFGNYVETVGNENAAYNAVDKDNECLDKQEIHNHLHNKC